MNGEMEFDPLGDPGFVAAADPTEDFMPENRRDLLQEMEKSCRRDDPYLYAYRGGLYNNVVFVHGLQSLAFNLNSGSMVDLRDYDQNPDRLYASLNIILPVIENQKAILLGANPEVRGAPRTNTEKAIGGARYCTALMRYADEFFNMKRLRRQAASYFAEMGGFIQFLSWDPAGGRVWDDAAGNIIFEGAPLWEIHSPLEWHFHPHATCVEESPYAYRVFFAPKEWVKRRWPFLTDEDLNGSQIENTSGSGQFYANRIRNMTPSHGTTWSQPMDSRDGFVEMHYCYWRSSTDYPEGRLGIALGGDGYPKKTLDDVPNPHIDHKTGQRTLPVVYVGHIDVPGRLEKEALVPHLMPNQTYINEMASMWLENAQLNAFPRLQVPDGTDEKQFNDMGGSIVRVPLGSQGAGFIEAPPINADVPNFLQLCMQLADITSRPIGPLRQESQKKITSGIQQALSNEQDAIQVAPMATSWVDGWVDGYRLFLNNCLTFWSVPKRLSAVGVNEAMGDSFFTPDLIGTDVDVVLVPGSADQFSRMGAVAQWTEILQIPMIQAQAMSDPQIVPRFWESIGEDSLARTKRDFTAHRDKATRNIQKMRLGQPVMIQIQDHAETHETVLTNWMVTPEYDAAIAEDPSLEQRVMVYLQSIIDARGANIAAQAAHQQMMGGGGKGQDPASQKGSAGGAGGVPRQSAGFGEAPNPMENQGGNPLGPTPQA